MIKVEVVADYGLVCSIFCEPEPPPEKQLLAAMLQRAITDLTLPRFDVLDIWRQDAILWIHDLSDAPFSYIWLCEQLDLDPKVLLVKVKKVGIIYPRKWRINLYGPQRGKGAKRTSRIMPIY